jgi:hypothetical protein
MSQIQQETAMYDSDRKALEALVVDNPDLERLEALLDQFNIFEAIGAVWQELRHSDFLAFLLDPQQNHGLGDAFLKRLLQKVLVSAKGDRMPITPIDLDVWSLDEVFVRREWQNIDILLEDEAHKLAIIIENKIGSIEHSDQLRRYHQYVHQQHPDWSIIGLYLTPDGDIPSHEAYLPVPYTLVCSLLENLAESRASTLGADVLTLIKHYVQMLRRHIVRNSEINELCKRIYQKHRRALDLIYELRPDRQAMIGALLENLIQQVPGLVLDTSTKTYIRFALKEWDVPLLLEGNGWTPSGRILLFQFDNGKESLKINLYIGPGPQQTCQKLFDMAKQLPFSIGRRALTNKWGRIYQRPFLTPQSYEDTSDDELEMEIRKHWAAFLENDLPKLGAVIKAQEWIWQPPNNPANVVGGYNK